MRRLDGRVAVITGAGGELCGVMAEALGDVGCKSYIGRGESMLAMDVTVVNAADVDLPAGVGIAVVADELGHRPGLESRSMSP